MPPPIRKAVPNDSRLQDGDNGVQYFASIDIECVVTDSIPVDVFALLLCNREQYPTRLCDLTTDNARSSLTGAAEYPRRDIPPHPISNGDLGDQNHNSTLGVDLTPNLNPLLEFKWLGGNSST